MIYRRNPFNPHSITITHMKSSDRLLALSIGTEYQFGYRVPTVPTIIADNYSKRYSEYEFRNLPTLNFQGVLLIY